MQNHVDPNYFRCCKKDSAALLRTATVIVIASRDAATRDLEERASANALRVLSDIAALSTEVQDSTRHCSTSGPAQKVKPNHVVHRLMFYAAHTVGTPRPMLRVLADEASMRAMSFEKEAKQLVQARSVERALLGDSGRRVPLI